ncbi:MAG: hypothetical protein HY652_03610 [Acidobacteria bacterium]|nr:hypothetical protein [Acidobacteriota bacterium]
MRQALWTLALLLLGAPLLGAQRPRMSRPSDGLDNIRAASREAALKNVREMRPNSQRILLVSQKLYKALANPKLKESEKRRQARKYASQIEALADKVLRGAQGRY